MNKDIALERAAAQFEGYAANHHAQGKTDKAKTNEAMAAMMRQALAEPGDIAISDADIPVLINSRAATAERKGMSETATVLYALADDLEKGLQERPVDPLKAMRDLIMLIGDANVKAGWWQDANQDMRVHPSKTIRVAFVGSKMALAHSEISEALEGWRKSNATKTIMDDHLEQHPMVSVEIADAIIRLLDMAANIRLLKGDAPLDVAQAFVDKFAYNQVRADHKPENREKDGGKSI